MNSRFLIMNFNTDLSHYILKQVHYCKGLTSQTTSKVTDLEPLTKRSIQLLKTLYEKGKSTNTYTLRVKQDELSNQLGVSRQALNVHLRKLKNHGFIRTGRGFIDVTDKGLTALGVSTTPAFILLKVSPIKRLHVYEQIRELAVSQSLPIAGEVDALIIVERDNLDEFSKNCTASTE